MSATLGLARDRPTEPRVVVSGIGLVTGLGTSNGETWTNLIAGRHAFRVLDLPVAPGQSPHLGCPATRPDHGAVELLLQAASQARADAGLDMDPGGAGLDRDRAGVVVGLSKGDLRRLSALHLSQRAGGVSPLSGVIRQEASDPRQGADAPRSPFEIISKPETKEALAHWLLAWPNGVASLLARDWDFRGPCLAPVAACATGLVAAIRGAGLIRRGACDLVAIGAGDASLDPLLLGAFRRMGVLARVGDDQDPGRAVRPWDRRRSGFLVGEGAAVLILERDDHARARGISPYAELAGGALGSDAYHMTDLNPDPSTLAGVITRALANSGVEPWAIDHVNVHGTATRTNDPLECRALRQALGPRADHVACSANKSQLGHLLGAAGAAELAITCLSIRHGLVPPTLNLTDPDPACDLDGTPLLARPRAIEHALKLSIGFGGHLAAAVLKRAEPRTHDE